MLALLCLVFLAVVIPIAGDRQWEYDTATSAGAEGKGAADLKFTASAWTLRPVHNPSRERILHDNTPYHALHSMPRDRPHFAAGQRPPGDTVHEVMIAVKQNNLDALDIMLQERSHPNSPKYRQWLTREEVAAQTHNPVGLAAVHDWCRAEGIDVTWTASRGEFVRASASVATWNRVLRADFLEFHDTHPDSSVVREKSQRLLGSAEHRGKTAEEMTAEISPVSVTILRSKKVFLPEHLMDHVVGVHFTTQAPAILSLAPRLHARPKMQPQQEDRQTKEQDKDGSAVLDTPVPYGSEGAPEGADVMDRARDGAATALGAAIARNLQQYAR